MRVLFINRMASMVRGGGETFDIEMARYLEMAGVTTTFLSGVPRNGRAARPLVVPRSHVIKSPYTGHLPWDRIWQGWRLRVWDFRQFEQRAADWVIAHQDDYDLVQICEMPPLIDDLRARDCRLPISIRITAPDYHDPEGALQRADAVIASGTSLKHLREQGVDCVDIPNGVDSDLFHISTGAQTRRQSVKFDFTVIHVARFQKVKNHDMMLRAFQRIKEKRPNAVLQLIGSGPLQGHLERQVKRLGLENVNFRGEVPHRSLPALYEGADVAVVTSDSESFSFAALEAMSMNLPLVVTRTEWVPRLIGEGRGGRVVPIDDDRLLAKELLELADDPVKCRAMGHWNREEVLRKYQWPESASRLRSLYSRLITGTKQA